MKYEVFCDESCQEAFNKKDAHDYIGLGSIWIPAEYRPELKQNIKSIKNRHGITGELKWNKLSPSTYECYKEVIDYFFDSQSIRARVMIINSNDINDIEYNDSDAELSFYKFYYQLIHHWIFDFNEYNIFLDYKSNRKRSRLPDLWRILRNSNITSTIDNLQALPSEESVGIQLADILTGIVTAKFNNNSTSKAKTGIISYIENNKIDKCIRHTFKSEEKLNIFKINLRGGW